MKKIAFLLVTMAFAQANAAFLTIGLGGTTQYDGWSDMTATNNPGYPSFPGSGAWPSPIGSNDAGSGDGTLNKISGNAYPGGESIYSGGFSSTPNASAAVLRVSDSSVVSGLKTVVFQIEIGEAFGYDFYNNVFPTLSYNGGSQALTSSYFALVDSVQTGTFTNPDTSLEEPVYVNTYAQQWDLTGVVDTITSYNISWTTVQHSQVYALQADQSSVMTQVVPEPSTWALFAGAGVALFALRRRFAGA